MSEPILTFAQVVDRYQFTRRKLRNIIRKFSIPVLHYGGDIDDIRFDDVALTALEEALRCPSPSSAEKVRARLRSPARSASRMVPQSEYNVEQRATALLSRARKRPSLKLRSSETT